MAIQREEEWVHLFEGVIQKPMIDHSDLLANIQRVQTLTDQLHDQVESNAELYAQSRREIAEGIARIRDPVNAAYAK